MSYPILLNLRGRRVVVVGGGEVGARKVIDLLNEDALITVISPTLHPDLRKLDSVIDARLEFYAPGMLAELHPVLVLAVTDSIDLNRQVAEEARALGILVNLANESKIGDFTNMATARRGEITIGVSTGGAAPMLAAFLRDLLDARIGDEYVALAQIMGEVRPRVRATVSVKMRHKLWHSVLASGALDCLRSGDEAEARAIIDRLIAKASNESD
jgi:siroheme synthase-like protein